MGSSYDGKLGLTADELQDSKRAQALHRPSRRAWAAAAVATLAALGLYGATAAPDIALVDSGEFAAAAHTGGVAHPPGFPLYLLLARPFSHLPGFASPVHTLNLMSSLFAALAVGMCFLIAERSVAVWELNRKFCRGQSRPDVGRRESSVLLCAGVSALAWATARNPWSWSGLAEVYSLNIFLMSAAWWCALVWACAQLAEAASRSKRSRAPLPSRERGARGWLLAAVACAGLGLANNHAMSLLIFPALLLVVLAIDPAMLRLRRFVRDSAFVLMACLGLYAYLLVAARSDPGLGWGGIDSLSDLIRHVAGWQYRGQLSSSAELTRMVLRGFGSSLLVDCGVLASALAAIGVGLGLRRPARPGQRKQRNPLPSPVPVRAILLGAPLLLILLDLALVVTYTAGPEDRKAYELPAHLAWCVLAGLGAWLLAERLPVSRRPLALLPLLLVLVGWNLQRNFRYGDLSSEYAGRTFVRETLEAVPAGSIVFVTEWNFYAPYLYMRHVEGYRPDVSVVDVLMMRRAWYAAYLERSIPEYVEAARAEFDVFKEQVNRFDRGGSYDPAEIARSYTALLARWAEVGGERGGAFVDFGGLDRAQERDWITRLEPVPEGLLIRLEAKGFRAAEADPMSPKDAANLQYLRARIGAGERPLRNPLAMDPTSVRYFKVYDAYRKAIEASLLFSALTQSRARMKEWAAAYEAWFPDVAFVTANLRPKLANAPAPPPSSPVPAPPDRERDHLLEKALRQLRESQQRDRQE